MASPNSAKPLKILGLGNPILDIIAEVPYSLIQKYNLELNNMYLAEPKHLPLYNEVQSDYQYNYMPGGATLNSMRFCQALNKSDISVLYSGCIGNDKEGKSFEKLLKEEGLISHFEVNSQFPTGLSAVLINSNDRAMCTNLGASGKFTHQFFKSSILPILPEVDIIFSACYFASSSPETMFDCASFCAENNKYYSLSLAAVFIIQNFFPIIEKLLPYTDIIFGNKEEYITLAKMLNLNYDSFEDILKTITSLPKVNKQKQRVVVSTDSTNPIVVASSWQIGGVKIASYPTLKIPESKIVDVNGGGDAFVGGFFHALSNRKSIDECVYYGILASSLVIQYRGAYVPTEELSKLPPYIKI